MTPLIELSVREYLKRLAERKPTPGGGSVAALAGALAGALGKMVVEYSTDAKTDSGKRERIQAVGARLAKSLHTLSALVDEDAEAYAALAKLPPTPQDSHQVAARQEALIRAVEVPQRTIRICLEIIVILDEFKTAAKSVMLSDLGAAVVLARSAAESAAFMVRVNARDLGETVGPALVREAEQRCAEATQRSVQIESFLIDKL